MVLLATSTDPIEMKDIYSQIAEFRWLLNINGPSAGFTKSAVDLLKLNAGFLAAYRPRTKATGDTRLRRKDRNADMTLSTPISDPGSYGDAESHTTDPYNFENIPPEFQTSPLGIDFNADQYWPSDLEGVVSQL